VVWQPSSLVSLSNFSSRSDPSGVVSATIVLGPTAGDAQVQLRTISTDPTPFGPSNNIVTTLFSVTVSVGATPPPTPGVGQPATLRILSGDGQSGQPGAQLPVRLTARVEDSNGSPLSNVPVVWQSSQSVSLSNVSSTSDASGIVSATATLGSSPGPAQVVLQTTGGVQTPFGPTTGPVSLQTVFTMTVIQSPLVAQPAVLHILSGNNQSGPPGPLPTPLAARVEDAA